MYGGTEKKMAAHTWKWWAGISAKIIETSLNTHIFDTWVVSATPEIISLRWDAIINRSVAIIAHDHFYNHEVHLCLGPHVNSLNWWVYEDALLQLSPVF